MVHVIFDVEPIGLLDATQCAGIGITSSVRSSCPHGQWSTARLWSIYQPPTGRTAARPVQNVMGTMDAKPRTDQAWGLLEAISVLDGERDDDLAAAHAMLDHRLDLDRLVALAMNHSLLPALGEFVVAQEFHKLMPPAVTNHLINAWNWNRVRTTLLVREAGRVYDALAAEGISVAFTKGVVVQSTIYDRRGTRYFGDIDMMVRPADREGVRETLLRLGFAWAKRYDPRRQCLVDIRPERLAIYRRYPDHLPHFHRLSGDDGLPVLTVDVAFSLSWYNSRWQIPVEEALSETTALVVGEGVQLPSLTWPYTFVFMVFHLFREAWYERTVAEGDVLLTQFADLVRLWRRATPADIAAVRAITATHHLGDVMCWVAHHVDVLYSADLVKGLGVESYAEADWLCSAGGAGNSLLTWSGDMRSRLVDSRPTQFAPVRS